MGVGVPASATSPPSATGPQHHGPAGCDDGKPAHSRRHLQLNRWSSQLCGVYLTANSLVAIAQPAAVHVFSLNHHITRCLLLPLQKKPFGERRALHRCRMSAPPAIASEPASEAVITCLSLFDSFSAMAYLDGSCR